MWGPGGGGRGFVLRLLISGGMVAGVGCGLWVAGGGLWVVGRALWFGLRIEMGA